MKNVIKKFLKENNYHKGQIYKVCPSKLLEEFTKFAEDTFIERYDVTEEGLEIFKEKKEDFITKQFNK